MKASRLNKSSWMLAAIFACLASLAFPQKSLAADTAVTCYAPVVAVWATGGGPTPAANVFIDCTGGSSVGFEFFAYRIGANPTVATMIPTLVGSWVQQHGPSAPITLYSDLSNTSGNNWGCGSSNCRILDILRGY